MDDDIDEHEGSPPPDGVFLEEGAHDHEGSSGLELDARQTAEIRQIFLTTLPDYLAPIGEMVARLSSEPDDSGQIRGSLAKTVASIAEAASRVSLDDVARTMETLREDVMLLGDTGEPQEALRERIASALAALGELAAQGSAETADARRDGRGETIVAALRGMEGVDAAALQKLMAAGVIFVDQLRDADPREVMAVSGLDAETVATLVRSLPVRHAAFSPAGPPAAPAASAPVASAPAASPAPPDDALGEVGRAIRTLVDDELALDEARGEALRLRVAIQTLREDAILLERQCEALRAACADARERAAERVTTLGRVAARKAALDRDHAATLAALEETARRLTALRSERREAIDELGHLADETASLTEQVGRVLESQEAHDLK